MSINTQIFTVEVMIWILPLVFITLGIGFLLGRELVLRGENSRLRREREKMLKALQVMVQSTEQLTTDVGSHNHDLASVEKTVSNLHAPGDFDNIQSLILDQINAVEASNKRLEDDLVVTRYQFEEQAQELDRTRVEARTDALSGLSNRKAFDETLQFMISKYNREGDEFSVVLCDVDHFKRINDTHGHQSGDRVVGILGTALRQYVRPMDHVFRFGGDEFAILLVGLSEENARRAAARIRAAVERTNFDVGVQGARVAVTLSMGMAFPHSEDSIETIFDRADQALYASKSSGRNQLHAWDMQGESLTVCR